MKSMEKNDPALEGKGKNRLFSKVPEDERKGERKELQGKIFPEDNRQSLGVKKDLFEMLWRKTI